MSETEYDAEEDDGREQYINQNIVLLGNVGDARFSFFSIICPACGEKLCHMSVEDGDITSFDAHCPECRVHFRAGSVAAISEESDHWSTDGEDRSIAFDRRESVTLDDIRRRMIELWEGNLRDGKTMEKDIGPNETEDVDVTRMLASSYQYQAERFGWSWTPPEDAILEGEEE